MPPIMSTSMLPSEYGYVVLVGSGTVLLNLFQMMRIGKLRRGLGIKYPEMYSDKHPEFNYAQRAHQNTLENLPFMLSGMFMAGLRMPLAAASCGAIWIAGRVAYTIGYWKAPEKRTAGFMISLLGGQFPLLFLSVYSGLGLLGVC